MNAEFLSYSRSKGLFAGVNLDGTVLSQNEDDTRTMYGANVPYTEVLKGNQPDSSDGAGICGDGGEVFCDCQEQVTDGIR